MTTMYNIIITISTFLQCKTAKCSKCTVSTVAHQTKMSSVCC